MAAGKRGDTAASAHAQLRIHNFTAKPGFYEHVREPISLEKLVASFEHDPYDFNPGEKFSYCNSGYVLLGLIIEKVTGENYETYLRKTFFEPLGMKDTGVYPSGSPLPNEALGYSFENGAIHRAVDWDMSNVATAGELYSTAQDLFRWNEALFTAGGRGGFQLVGHPLEAVFEMERVQVDQQESPAILRGLRGWLFCA